MCILECRGQRSVCFGALVLSCPSNEPSVLLQPSSQASHDVSGKKWQYSNTDKEMRLCVCISYAW